MARVYKVVTKPSAESTEEVVNFDTENGADSDSMLDARKAFGDAWFAARTSDDKATAVVSLFENGALLEAKTNFRQPVEPKPKAEKKAKKAAAAPAPGASDDAEPIDAAESPPKKAKKSDGAGENGSGKKAKAKKSDDAGGNGSGKKAKVPAFTDSEGKEVETAKSAYVLFCAEKRGEVKAAVEAELAGAAEAGAADDAEGGAKAAKPNAFGETTKRLAGLWKALGEAGKAPFEAAAAADKARFEAAVASNPDNEAIKAARKQGKLDGKRKSGEGQAEGSAKKAKMAKLLDGDGAEIKKAVSAYFHFSAEKRAEVAEQVKAEAADGKGSVTKVAAKLGELWKALDEGGKATYEALAEADKARYEAAVASNPDNGWIAEAAAKKAADKEEAEAKKEARKAEKEKAAEGKAAAATEAAAAKAAEEAKGPKQVTLAAAFGLKQEDNKPQPPVEASAE